ncbi:MAG: patatin-like phospholipase family protein [Burkholderiales bacterium]
MPLLPPHTRPRLGLALGGGAARGWAHIGVLLALDEAGLRPDVVCGTSVGAMVGAAYAAGEIKRFERWVRGMGLREVVSFLDVGFSGGMLKGERLMAFYRRNFVDRHMEDLPLPFGAVATVLHSGAEKWLLKGSTVEAVRASIALPALFTPVVLDGVTLVDGALVNPVPVSLARAMGADLVIAVDLNSDLLGRHLPPGTLEVPEPTNGTVGDWRRALQSRVGALFPSAPGNGPVLPSMLDVVANSINIMQVRITRSRMAGDPPDISITPRLSHIGLLEFHRGAEAIAAGRRAVEAALPLLQAVLPPATALTSPGAPASATPPAALPPAAG